MKKPSFKEMHRVEPFSTLIQLMPCEKDVFPKSLIDARSFSLF